MSDTELKLAAWRSGSTQAERLAAAVLRLSGYEEIDPQSPIGGPDGGKDILCVKGGIVWTCAVYFPPTQVSFTKVKKKFIADLTKASSDRRGFAFVTNCPLTPTQRKTLESAGTAAEKDVDIFHLERLRALLDAPRGYGVRLQFLNIAMTLEDQLSWFSETDDRVLNAINLNTREVLSIKALIQRLEKNNAEIVRTMSLLGITAPPTPDLLSTVNFSAVVPVIPVTTNISIAMILLVHRLSCFDMPSRSVGVLRTTDVWLVNQKGERTKHLQPPHWSLVPDQLEQLCQSWRDQCRNLAAASADGRLKLIAEFHAKLLSIHPFADGNGRLARALMMQQCLDLFGTANMSLLEQGSSYYQALVSADEGNIAPLISLLKPVVDR